MLTINDSKHAVWLLRQGYEFLLNVDDDEELKAKLEDVNYNFRCDLTKLSILNMTAEFCDNKFILGYRSTHGAETIVTPEDSVKKYMDIFLANRDRISWRKDWTKLVSDWSW